MLVDALVVDDEIDLLVARLRVMASEVDQIVVLESPTATDGTAKPLFARNAWERLMPWSDQISYVVTDLPATSGRWEVAAQALQERVEEDFPGAIALLCGVASIPSRAQLEAARWIDRAHAIPMRSYARRVNWALEEPVRPAVAVPVVPGTGSWQELGGGEGEHPALEGEPGMMLREVGHPEAPSTQSWFVEPPQRWSERQRQLFAVDPSWFDLDHPRSTPCPHCGR